MGKNGSAVQVNYFIDEFVWSYNFKYVSQESLKIYVPDSSFEATATVPTYKGMRLNYVLRF